MHPASQIRSARAVAALVSLGLAASLLSLSLMAVNASSQSPGEGFLWVLSIEGGSVKTTIRDNGAPNPEDLFKSTSIATQKGKIDFYFMVNPDGSITPVGTPNGQYTELTWHLEGVDGEPSEPDAEGKISGGPFNCDPPVTGADFNPIVSGTATDTRMILKVDLLDAFEKNDEEDCGGGFLAYATTSQYLQESLLFCKDRAGPITLPYAATYTASCEKSEPRLPGQYSVQGDTRRKTEHSWKLELTRTNGPPPTSSPSPTATTSPTPGVTPSSSPPSPGASPSPTPTATPSTHSRVSLLVLRKHLNAYGAVVLAGWGAPECVDAVNLRIQQRLGRSPTPFWKTEKTVITNSVGVWSTKLKDSAGHYRALAPEVKKDQAMCKKAVSKVKTHNHR